MTSSTIMFLRLWYTHCCVAFLGTGFMSFRNTLGKICKTPLKGHYIMCTLVKKNLIVINHYLKSLQKCKMRKWRNLKGKKKEKKQKKNILRAGFEPATYGSLFPLQSTALPTELSKDGRKDSANCTIHSWLSNWLTMNIATGFMDYEFH